ncbi:hypothetical protein OIDMADRAFT_61418 [Oidiodendron maius Zn]|uniref:Uncharacterized protein n=1 Tax=Oidiodendron maius (strain Zn) TaxID=913774 RepID=A0A0C3GR18_OIDMZ|nr:hypothetical protein OIDMADRAFT_61418 [Oidiodendron maius Zn]
MPGAILRGGVKRLRCIIIGAGVSGILMAHRLSTELRNEVEFQIFEKNLDLGGTWLENQYPGCACDVPSHVYQFSFAPNPYWSSYYAKSSEIQNYLRAVCTHFNLSKHISYNAPVISAIWNQDKAIWQVSVQGKGDFEADILVNAGGILNNPQMPVVKNLCSFRGHFLHTAAWDDRVELTGKNIVLIGAGASAVQLLPQIQPLAKHIDVFIRTPSWISPPAGAPKSGERNHTYTREEKERFRDDPSFSLSTRKEMEGMFNMMYKVFFKGTKEQEDVREKFATRMRELIPDPELQKKLIPSFDVGCRRINPGEEYLVSLQKENVEPVFDPITEVVHDGIVSKGRKHQADVIIAATGFNTSFCPRFPIIGSNDVNLQDIWSSNPTSYFGIGVSGFPNYLTFLGPNTPISNGSLMGPLEATADYFTRLIRKFHSQKAKSFDVRPEVQRDFDQHTQEFMKDMVWTGTCRSWFKRSSDGKVTALWPGSSLHYIGTLAENRWEDYNWVFPRNRFAYWDGGFSQTEREAMLGEGVDADGQKFPNDHTAGGLADFSFYLRSAPPLPLEALIKASLNGKPVVNGKSEEATKGLSLTDVAAFSV